MTAPMAHTVCGPLCNFRLVFIRWDLFTLTFDLASSRYVLLYGYSIITNFEDGVTIRLFIILLYYLRSGDLDL